MPPKKASPVKPATSGRPVAPAGKKTATNAVKKSTSSIKGNVKPTGTKIAPGKKSDVKPAAPKVRQWTKQDDAARIIQSKVRQHLAKKKMKKVKEDKAEYEAAMDTLEREAYVKMVEMYREQAEKERAKEEEERRRRKQERERVKKMMEASFDGDSADIANLIREVSDLDSHLGNDPISRGLKQKHLDSLINAEDANGNTPLSEASSGGHAETIKILIDKGADINSQGQFMRTPLYRAAFAGHLEACEVLLLHGADPRIYASDGQSPAHISSVDTIKHLIENWDMTQTEALLGKIEAEKERRLAVEREQREAELEKIESQIKEAEKEYDVQQKRLTCLYNELNKRIYEHDTAALQGFDKPEVTLQTIHDAEAELEICKIDHDKARDNLAQLRLKRREQERTNDGLSDDDLPGVKVSIRELEEVLLRDVGNKIIDSGKWPLIIDPSSQASTFLRYQDTNYINALRPTDMESDKIRLSLLGAIRFGKPAVLDMMEVDMYEACVRKFDDVIPGLMALIMNRDIMKEENYSKLIKQPQDGTHYLLKNFMISRTERFRMFFLTKNPYPPEDLVEQCYLLRVHVPV